MLLLALLWTAAGCRISTSPDSESRTVLTIREGEFGGIPGTTDRIRFLDVISDSRCPQNVVCITEGSARVAFRLETGEGSVDFEITGYASPQGDGDSSILVDGLTVTLLALEPYPVDPPITGQINSVTLRVERR